MAIRGFKEDREFQVELANAINENIIGVAKALGAKVKPRPKPKKQVGTDERQPLDLLLAQYGGKGVVIKK